MVAKRAVENRTPNILSRINSVLSLFMAECINFAESNCPIYSIKARKKLWFWSIDF